MAKRSLIGVIGCVGMLFLGISPLFSQAFSSPFFIQEFDAPASYPAWLKPIPPPNSDASLFQLSYSVTIPEGISSSDLLLTVVFDESKGGLLRVYRQDGPASETVSENLYEGTGLPNQRILLLHHVAVQGPTTIVFQASSSSQPTLRIVWEWPQLQTVAVTGQPSALIHDRLALAAEEITGQPLPSPQPDVAVNHTSTPILIQPTRIEGVASFIVVPGRPPSHALLTAQIAGLPLSEQLECWVNGHLQGTLAPALPSLRDPAYLFRPDRTASLASWRKAAVYLPSSAWRDGDNQIEFRPIDNPSQIYAIKDVALEFVYQDRDTVPTPSSTSPSP